MFLDLTNYSHLWLYVVLLIGIIALPGMDMAFVMGSTMAGGRKQGFAAIAGIILGVRGHDLMAWFGIGLILKSVPGLFPVMLLGGALYMIWIGIKLFKGVSALTNIRATRVFSVQKTFWQGVLSAILNPKAYLFMLAVYPQFVRPEYGPLGQQVLLMALLCAVCQLVIYGAVCLGVDGLRIALQNNPQMQVRVGQAFSVLMIAAALWSLKSLYTGF